jgi:hypothetical protein
MLLTQDKRKRFAMRGLQRPCRGQLTMQEHWGTQDASRAFHWQLVISLCRICNHRPFTFPRRRHHACVQGSRKHHSHHSLNYRGGSNATHLQHSSQTKESHAAAAVRHRTWRWDPGKQRQSLPIHYNWVTVPACVIPAASLLHVPQQCIEQHRPCMHRDLF